MKKEEATDTEQRVPEPGTVPCILGFNHRSVSVHLPPSALEMQALSKVGNACPRRADSGRAPGQVDFEVVVEIVLYLVSDTECLAGS